MERIKHDLRLSETVSPFGVGAIVDIRGESLIAPDTSWWDKQFAPQIHCQRLSRRLGDSTLREAPTHAGRAGKDTKAQLYWRFPAWRFCERCTKLSSTTGRNKGKWKNSCDCGGALVPMRYVAVCEKGSHIQDIPWFMWAHRGHDGGVTDAVRFCRAYKELKFIRSAARGEGLGSLQVCVQRLRSIAVADGPRHERGLEARWHPLRGHPAVGRHCADGPVRTQARGGAAGCDGQLHRRTNLCLGHPRGGTGVARREQSRSGRTSTSRRFALTTAARKQRWSPAGSQTNSRCP